MKSITAKSLMPMLSVTVFRKAAFVSCVCVCVCACLALSVSADTLTVTAGTVSGGDLMSTLTKATYSGGMPDLVTQETGGVFNLSPATIADGSSLGDGFDSIKYGSVPPNSVTDGSYFWEVDFGGLNFDRKKVMSISLPIAFVIGYDSDINGGFVARFTVNGVPVGNFFDCSPDGTVNLRHDGSVLMDYYLFRSVLTYNMSAPTDAFSVGVVISRKDSNSGESPWVAPQDFAFSCGRLSYEYVSSEQVDVITPEQSQAAQEAQDTYESQAQEVHDQLEKLPDTSMTVPDHLEISSPKEFDVFNVFNFGDLPYVWTIVASAFSFSGISLILYGIRK